MSARQDNVGFIPGGYRTQELAAKALRRLNDTAILTANLHSTYPPSEDLDGKIVVVSDLYGVAQADLICLNDGEGWKWVPIAMEPPALVTSADNGTFTVEPLVTATTIVINNDLAGTWIITLSDTYAWVGMEARVCHRGAQNAYYVQVVGLLGATENVLMDGPETMQFTYTPDGWQLTGLGTDVDLGDIEDDLEAIRDRLDIIEAYTETTAPGTFDTQSTQIAALDTRLTAAEAAIADHETRITALEP